MEAKRGKTMREPGLEEGDRKQLFQEFKKRKTA